MDFPKRLGLGEAQLALSSFVACRHPTESCGHNGLPLTPNSIAIFGRASYLKTLEHDNLCVFLDCKRGKNERIITASEFFPKSLNDIYVSLDSNVSNGEAEVNSINDKEIQRTDFVWRMSKETLQALAYLDYKGVVHTNLDPSNILLTKANKVKLFNYGLGHVTNYGKCVAFPVFGNPRLTGPEVFLTEPVPGESESGSGDDDLSPSEPQDSIAHIVTEPRAPPYASQSSVWRLGMILVWRLFGIDSFWPTLKVPQIIRKVMSFAGMEDGKAVLDKILREHNKLHLLILIPEDLKTLMCRCLEPDFKNRMSPADLLQSDLFQMDGSFLKVWKEEELSGTFPTLKLRCKDLTWPPQGFDENDNEDNETALDVLSIQEIYYLWELAGGDVVAELGRHGLMVTMPPIVALPKIVLGEGHFQGQAKEKCSLYDPTVVVTLSTNQLSSCLDSLTIDDLYPCVTINGVLISDGGDDQGDDGDDDSSEKKSCTSSNDLEQVANLPLVIKERDVRYQFSRIVLYRKLLQGYPFKRPLIWKEARTDSLPLYRAYIWAALLGIEHDVVARYNSIDKESWTPTDRQIEVDIPRCHQYNNLLASPEGHRKFKRVLKAWVVTNTQYVYWQGLDSLCAPFLYLNFNDEALAYACLSAFIPKYLYGMFRKDNAAVIQEYLAKFAHIQAFHDPLLFNHLDGIGFIPDLYAIPWVLTMFAHVFPLHSIFHLWDKLLLGNSSFPLCVALAILYRLRDRLLSAEFNDCILLFSDLPAIDIELCVKDSIQIFCTTPKSLTYRRYGCPEEKKSMEGKYSDLTMETITLSEQKTEKVPRISGQDLLELLGLQVASIRKENGSSERSVRPRALVLDIRPFSEFKLGTLPDSLNCPYVSSSSNSEEGHLALSKETLDKLSQRRGKIICIVGSAYNNEAQLFAAKLLSLNYSRLCVLHKGIEIFRSAGVLCVPNT